MNQVLEILNYFETAPLEDAKYASTYLRRPVARREADEAERRQPKPRKPQMMYGPGTARYERREKSIAARTERALEAAGRELSTREITEALKHDGAEPITIESIRPALAREIKRSGARIVRLQDGVYTLRELVEGQSQGQEPPEGAEEPSESSSRVVESDGE